MPTREPLLAVTMGDACGIGPEIVARALTASDARSCVVVGDAGVMRRAVAQCGLAAPVVALQVPADARGVPAGSLAVWQPPGLADGAAALASLPMGRVDARSGAAAARCIEAAAALALRGEVQAIVTAPIHKQALHAAGIAHPGHTEMLQALAAGADGSLPPVRMMLANDELKVVLATIHVALRRAIDMLSTELVLQTLRIAHTSAAGWGQPRPRIAVAGLNPHAGEDGLFGDEEIRLIEPAIRAACAEGIDARGPFAPDTVFMRARHAPSHAGEFDLVVAMTHDHGLIPLKYLGVEQGVNVTLGLPFVRTSPDHGTAFDIAGRGVADARSMQAALHWARRAVASRAA
jgi:4-hydroxythreonine-4-phosphate dehydrogenase